MDLEGTCPHGHPRARFGYYKPSWPGHIRCRECDRIVSKRWKDQHREQNRGRDRAYSAMPENRGICESPICTKLRGKGALSRANIRGYCTECAQAIADVRRTLGEGMWAAGWTCREIADAFGAKTKAYIAVMRSRGWDLPHRRSPEEVANITAGVHRGMGLSG